MRAACRCVQRHRIKYRVNRSKYGIIRAKVRFFGRLFLAIIVSGGVSGIFQFCFIKVTKYKRTSSCFRFGRVNDTGLLFYISPVLFLFPSFFRVTLGRNFKVFLSLFRGPSNVVFLVGSRSRAFPFVLLPVVGGGRCSMTCSAGRWRRQCRGCIALFLRLYVALYRRRPFSPFKAFYVFLRFLSPSLFFPFRVGERRIK